MMLCCPACILDFLRIKTDFFIQRHPRAPQKGIVFMRKDCVVGQFPGTFTKLNLPYPGYFLCSYSVLHPVHRAPPPPAPIPAVGEVGGGRQVSAG